MRIRRIRIALPPRMKGTAAADARLIAETIATALHGSSAGGAPLRIAVDGAGRPARHLTHDLVGAAGRAARTSGREG